MANANGITVGGLTDAFLITRGLGGTEGEGKIASNIKAGFFNVDLDFPEFFTLKVFPSFITISNIAEFQVQLNFCLPGEIK